MSDPAKSRWILLNAMRIGGLIFMVIGLLIWRKGIGGFQDEMIGKAVFLIGLLETLIIPAMLRRAWRSKDTGGR